MAKKKKNKSKAKAKGKAKLQARRARKGRDRHVEKVAKAARKAAKAARKAAKAARKAAAAGRKAAALARRQQATARAKTKPPARGRAAAAAKPSSRAAAAKAATPAKSAAASGGAADQTAGKTPKGAKALPGKKGALKGAPPNGGTVPTEAVPAGAPGAPAGKKAKSGGRRSKPSRPPVEEVPLRESLRALSLIPSDLALAEFDKMYKKEKQKDSGSAALQALDKIGLAYWFDYEMIDEPDAYVEHLRRIAALSRGAFEPGDVEVEDTEDGRIRLRYAAGDETYEMTLRRAETTDDVPILTAVNQYLDTRGVSARYGLFTPQDQSGVIIYGPVEGLLRVPSLLDLSWGVRRDRAADLLAVESADLSDWAGTADYGGSDDDFDDEPDVTPDV
ncbi:MAG TPA: hypothetical protein VG389_04015 [Myxococcota bacterium]|jgi:hypothetical protein|nr:hypothetical protein [Myxococcota bacterium]